MKSCKKCCGEYPLTFDGMCIRCSSPNAEGIPPSPMVSDAVRPLALRDRFAIAALTGLLHGRRADELTDTDISMQAYDLADAMMEARGK